MKHIKNILILVFGLFFITLGIASSDNITELFKLRRGVGSWGTTNFLILGLLGLVMVFISIRNLIKGNND